MNQDGVESALHLNLPLTEMPPPSQVDYERLLELGRELLLAIGEDPNRPDLIETPRRWASWWREFIEYDPGSTGTLFEGHSTGQMIVVSGMRVWSLCVPAQQMVDVVDGQKGAADVVVGDRFWTLHGGQVVPTNVVAISRHKTHDLVEVETDAGVFRVTPDHPLATPQGWVEAQHLAGCVVAWSAPQPLWEKEVVSNLASAFASTAITPGAAQMYAADHWVARHGFRQEDLQTDLMVSTWVTVRRVTPIRAEEHQPFTVYSFKCDPHPTFLIEGHLTHNCEHHLLPFWCDISIGYITHQGALLGLSKFARIAHQFAHRLQLQERLVNQIADEVEQLTGSPNIAVVANGEHLCMTMRGIRTPSVMTSSVMRGLFLENPDTRAEFWQMLKK